VQETMERLGRPLFTTKEGGSGLGLAICYSIATRHNAAILFDSSDKGTAVYVRFTRFDGLSMNSASQDIR
jgi:two-component system, sporulation sensor kinase E